MKNVILNTGFIALLASLAIISGCQKSTTTPQSGGSEAAPMMNDEKSMSQENGMSEMMQPNPETGSMTNPGMANPEMKNSSSMMQDSESMINDKK